MVVNSLSVVNFKSIGELSLDFSSLGGMWEISGPVGSGKTSIGEALMFALFGSVKDKNNDELVKWGQKKMETVVELTSRGKQIRIHRVVSKTSASPIEVTINGEPLVFTNKRDAQSILENEYYDISRMTLELLCVISFNGFKSLSCLNANDSRKFLDQTFALSKVTELAECSKEEGKAIDGAISENSSEQYALEKQKKKFEEWKDLDANDIRAQIARKSELLDCEKSKLDAINEEKERLMKDTRDSVSDLSTRMGTIKSDGMRKKKEIDFLSKGICPTCGAKLDVTNLEQYKREREELLSEYSRLSAELSSIESEISSKKAEISVREKGVKSAISDLQGSIGSLNEQLKQADACDIEIDSITGRLESLKCERASMDAERSQWSELTSCLSGDMRSIILGDYVPHINAAINSFMVSLRQPYSVSIDNSFKCSVRVNTVNEEIPVSSLSAGQSKLLDMVIILGVLKVLLNKVNFNICFCDELLSNMDNELRSKMCMLLKSNLMPSQSMFLICHAPLDSQWLDGTLRCELSNGSTVVSVEASKA